MTTIRRYVLTGLLMLALLAALHTMTLADELPDNLPVRPLSVVTQDGTIHRFTVRLADTHESRRRGLMFVTRMAPHEGMLFDFGNPRPVSMWMRNTPLSLDMLFVEADGRILRIEQSTKPLSERLIHSGGNVRWVLELLAGTSARLGIAAGDRLELAEAGGDAGPADGA
ncbi:MAG: DUF192 domain-containing protein [Anaerolineae bacterium]